MCCTGAHTLAFPEPSSPLGSEQTEVSLLPSALGMGASRTLRPGSPQDHQHGLGDQKVTPCQGLAFRWLSPRAPSSQTPDLPQWLSHPAPPRGFCAICSPLSTRRQVHPVRFTPGVAGAVGSSEGSLGVDEPLALGLVFCWTP